MPSGTTLIKSIGLLRAAVGIAMLAAPVRIGGREEPGFVLLLRTIGVRDLVLGTGTLLAAEEAAPAWGTAALASDSLDTVIGALAAPRLGWRAGLVATLLPLPFVAAGLLGFRGLRRAHAPSAPGLRGASSRIASRRTS